MEYRNNEYDKECRGHHEFLVQVKRSSRNSDWINQKDESFWFPAFKIQVVNYRVCQHGDPSRKDGYHWFVGKDEIIAEKKNEGKRIIIVVQK